MTTVGPGLGFTVTPREYDAVSGKPHRNGGFFMSATEQTPPRARRTPKVKKPIAGPWDWRANLPRCVCELKELRRRTEVLNPDHVDIPRFIWWAEAAASGEADGPGMPRSQSTLARYRRLLYELNVDHEPAHEGDDLDVTQLPCCFGGVAETAENPCSVK